MIVQMGIVVNVLEDTSIDRQALLNLEESAKLLHHQLRLHVCYLNRLLQISISCYLASFA